jgi:hypothetical protein
MKKVYHAMLMRGGILIGDVNNYVQWVQPVSFTAKFRGARLYSWELVSTRIDDASASGRPRTR